MKRSVWLLLVAAALIHATGCKRQGAIETTELENAFPAATEPAPASEPGPASSTPTDAQPVERIVRQAVSAIRSSDYDEAVVTLQALRSASSLTPEQLTAVQDTMGNLQTRLAELAERGDPKARQAMETLRQLKRR